MTDGRIIRLLADYCHLVDDAQYDEWAELFAEDSVISANGQPLASTRQGINEWIKQRFADPAQRGRHLVFNAAITVEGDRGWSRSDWIFLHRTASGPSIVGLGRYVDTLVRLDDVWHFEHRDIVVTSDWLPSAAAPGR